MNNNLSRHWQRFSRISPRDVRAKTEELLKESQQAIDSLADDSTPSSWEGFAISVEDILQNIESFWSPVAHLNAVMSTEEWRNAFNESNPLIVSFFTRLQQNHDLYKKYIALSQSPDFGKLGQAKRRIIELSIKNFELSGVNLPKEKQKKLSDIEDKLALLMNKFAENSLDSTNFFKLHIQNKEELEEIPERVVKQAAELAKKQGKSGWILTLQEPCFMPVMRHAKNRNLRETMYKAYVTQASDLFSSYAGGSNEWDNSKNIKEIMDLRLEKAHLLEFANFAEYSLSLKMADTTGEVNTFLEQMVARTKEAGVRDANELREFAKNSLGIDKMEQWDLSYASEQLKISKFQLDNEKVRQYFPWEKVLEGLFLLVETLYDIVIEKIEVPVYHTDVKVYQIKDKGSLSVIGHFYLDPFARENKRSGAWVDGCRTRHRRIEKELETPVTYVVCNFPGKTSTLDSYLSHNEIITLFHEFGHALHQLLTEVDVHSISGFNGVEWDAVEIPSQFMENFAWDESILVSLSAHEVNNTQLPNDVYQKMIAAKNFHVGLAWLRQLEFSIFDFRIHENWSPKMDVMEELWKVQEEVAVIIPPRWNRFPMMFGHIFASPAYAAGYYSYKWAEVLSADAFEAFEESGVIVNKEVGNLFRREIISAGASRPMKDSFRKFRGRDPQINALLRHNGIL
ncbi:M3 family metallopeptidase [Candidatus Ichthyocystis hellenicum]|uniref:M3 family metallopeptidase n=1 Tax=Candidatus Ichthyocystis hellenicum TaxID=1561003 RepID=UPI000AF2D4AD|nr:M3 family metallopeptidase [Candidatus Ichthyocystis hellenicum]